MSERKQCMSDGNVIQFARPEENEAADRSYEERLLAELDDLSLYKLVRRARRNGQPIRPLGPATDNKEG